MKELTLLEKEDGFIYSVAVDNYIHRPVYKEIFTYCLVAEKDGEIFIFRCITVINDYTGKVNSPYDRYCRELANYYNCKLLIETD